MEIIPNWHPVFVHFTIALISSALLFMLLMISVRKESLREQWRIVARWNLWLGAAFTLLTLLAGFQAFGTVEHDNASHAAMELHRNWALSTSALLVVVVLWSIRCCQQGKIASYGFLMAMIVLVAMLISTAWHGAELVYRHGLGVMSLPTVTEHNHDDGGHYHHESESNNKSPSNGEVSALQHDHGDHEH